METKQCSKCGKVKPLCEFSANKKTRLGVQSACRSCVKEWAKKNREVLALSRKKYREKNKEKVYARQRIWKEKNQDKVRMYRSKTFKKGVATLSDSYIRVLLCRGRFSRHLIPESLLEAKRFQLLIERKLHEKC